MRKKRALPNEAVRATGTGERPKPTCFGLEITPGAVLEITPAGIRATGLKSAGNEPVSVFSGMC